MKIFELHGWSELRERLRALAIDGKREEMQREIPDEVLREFAQTSTYDNLPQFIRQHREYARRMYFVTPIRNEEDRARFRYLLGELQKLQTPGVPTGMEIG